LRRGGGSDDEDSRYSPPPAPKVKSGGGDGRSSYGERETIPTPAGPLDAQKVRKDAKDDCELYRYGEKWSEERAVRLLREGRRPEARDVAEEGCRAAYRSHA
jgi:hypothetical protein